MSVSPSVPVHTPALTFSVNTRASWGKTSMNVLRKEKSLRISPGTEAICVCATEITAKEEGKFFSYSRLD